MSNTILIKRSGVAAAQPSAGNLSLGELAINYTDGNLFYKNNGGVVTVIASNQFLSVTGNVTANNGMFTNIVNVASHTGAIVSVTGNITGNYILGNGAFLSGIDTSLISSGNSNVKVYANSNVAVSVDGTSNVAVFTTTGLSLAGNTTANNGIFTTTVNTASFTGGLVSVTGNVTANNGIFTNIINVASFTGGLVSVTGNVDANNGMFTTIVNTASFTGGLVSVTGNVTANNGSFTNIVNVTSFTGSTISVTGNLSGANINAGGLITATGNITSAGNISAGNLVTGGLVSATGNISTAANVGVSGYVTVVGNVIAGNVNTTGLLSTSGNVQASNVNATLVAATTLSATGNVNGGNINSNNIVGTTLNIKASALNLSSTGNINLTPSGNIILANSYINGLAMPVQDYDAATKLYVDNFATTGITFHEPVYVATNTTLETATGGTITYAQPNGAGNGVGATLTTTGAFYLIDTANVQTVGTRILVQTQANAVQNGIYTYANTTAIVRSTDADEYGSDSTTQLSVNDYFFVQSGNVNAGAAFVVNAPPGTITFGTSNITFAQFSSSQVYTANTAAGLVLNGTVFSAKVDNTTTAFDGTGNIVVKTSANLTTPNIGAATGTSLSTTGNITSGNINTPGIVTATKGIQSTPIGNAIANSGAFTTLTANGAVTFTSNVDSTGYTTGAVVVSGGLGVAGNIEMPGTAQIHVGSELGGAFAGSQLLLVSNVNSYSQAVKQNISDGGSASSDWVAVANNGDDSSFYIDMGINSNTYSDAAFTAQGANDGYLYVNGGNLVMGTQTTGKNIVFHAGNTLAANIVATLSYTNLTLSQNTVSTSTSSGALILAGTNAGLGVAGNIYSGGLMSATGNITGNYILGNGAFLSGVITSVANINNGTSNVTVVSSGGNVTVGIGGTSNVAVFATTGEYITGLLSVSGNITSGNISTAGNVNGANLVATTLSATANVVANNVVATTIVNSASFTGTIISVSGNITGGNISTAGNVNGANIIATTLSVTANVVANNVMSTTIVNTASFTGGLVSVTGNVTANNGIFTNIVNVASHTGAVVSVSGNVTGGNLTTAGTGNVATLIVTTLANITATTTSTSSITGAVIVAGGLGVAGNIYGGALYDNGTAVLTINSTVDGGTY